MQTICALGVSPASDDEDPSTLLLDFGDNIIMKKTVTRQLLLANKTAIAAPFTIEPEYFSCCDTVSHCPERRYPPRKCPQTCVTTRKNDNKILFF